MFITYLIDNDEPLQCNPLLPLHFLKKGNKISNKCVYYISQLIMMNHHIHPPKAKCIQEWTPAPLKKNSECIHSSLKNLHKMSLIGMKHKLFMQYHSLVWKSMHSLFIKILWENSLIAKKSQNSMHSLQNLFKCGHWAAWNTNTLQERLFPISMHSLPKLFKGSHSVKPSL